jgi:hypothetical protein
MVGRFATPKTKRRENEMKAIAVFLLAMVLMIPLSVLQTLFLLAGWWLAHDFFRLPMIGFWTALGMCIVSNTLIKSRVTNTKD